VAAAALGTLAALPAGVPLGVVLALAATLGAGHPASRGVPADPDPGALPGQRAAHVRGRHGRYGADLGGRSATRARRGLDLGLQCLAGRGRVRPDRRHHDLRAVPRVPELASGCDRTVGGRSARVARHAHAGRRDGRGGRAFRRREVAVTAAATALGHPAAAGSLFGLWGVGSLLGGIVAARRGGGANSGRGFAALLALLGLGHIAVGGATGSIVLLAVVVTAAGTMIAPVLTSAYAMVDGAAPPGTVTEAFAWLATASAVGASIGATAGGLTADAAGPAAAFVMAGGAALAAATVAALAVPRAGSGDRLKGPKRTLHPARRHQHVVGRARSGRREWRAAGQAGPLSPDDQRVPRLG
jgi:hypothetical protein